MPRLMSVALTEEAVRERRKTVTRRLGWESLRPLDRLILCPKTRGVPKAERVELAEVVVVDVRQEVLGRISKEDVVREGFDDMEPWEFVDMFCQAMGCHPRAKVTRIEWRYLD